jgi:hypothetical protein
VDEKFMARLFAAVAIIVLLGWTVGVVLAPIFSEGYRPAPEINIVVMAIVGIFGTLYNKAKNPKDGDEE